MRQIAATVAFLLATAAFGQDKAVVKGNALDIKLSTHGNDIAFSQTAIQVPFGKVVKLRFANQATKDSEIFHNVAVLKPGSADEVIKALQASGYDIQKVRSNPNILAMTKSLAPGMEDVLEFTPSAPGFYPYICLMPGHADMLGMRGLLNVKK